MSIGGRHADANGHIWLALVLEALPAVAPLGYRRSQFKGKRLDRIARVAVGLAVLEQQQEASPLGAQVDRVELLAGKQLISHRLCICVGLRLGSLLALIDEERASDGERDHRQAEAGEQRRESKKERDARAQAQRSSSSWLTHRQQCGASADALACAPADGDGSGCETDQGEGLFVSLENGGEHVEVAEDQLSAQDQLAAHKGNSVAGFCDGLRQFAQTSHTCFGEDGDAAEVDEQAVAGGQWKARLEEGCAVVGGSERATDRHSDVMPLEIGVGGECR